MITTIAPLMVDHLAAGGVSALWPHRFGTSAPN